MLNTMANKRVETAIPQKLSALRRKKGWTQVDVASRIGRAQSRVAKWELGEGMPTPRDLLRLADAFDVPIAYLCDDEMTDPAQASQKPDLSEGEVLILGMVRRIGEERAIDRLMGIGEIQSQNPQSPISVTQRPIKPK
jgi:transcriptional regulator with XRE-family HTH domain